ncbi:MAG: insulinase family protein [Lentimicrobiaceae bacterium]|nr:insulinase family protein [Lentimicrobiaceae bacterium]
MVRKSIFRRVMLLFVIASFAGLNVLAQYNYTTVADDPLQTRIYTLKNGLQVYLTVYKDAPRIQCYIPVKVGSKNDPKETTGLAHYFEHLMFKGSTNFGTTDWEKERPMIEQITQLFEVYRKETDMEKRAAIYREIDSISYEASKLAIPNEYDFMMKYIGSQGTNAATSNDFTFYVENIPSNQLENWAMIQADRFVNPVLRLFHTELETVYEEKNMSLTNDNRKANETMLSALFPNHPYGQQTTLGDAAHLKNPSMINIMEFFKKYYVANNMAVCLSGDFDFDEAIKIVDKYFSQIPSGEVPVLKTIAESPITQPVVREVIGLQAERITIAFRTDLPANSKEIYVMDMLNSILTNGKCGLIDALEQTQKVYSAGSYPYALCDNSAFVLYGVPKTGQTMDDVKTLLLEQLDLLKAGKFENWILEAAINNMKLREMRQLESNQSRAMWLSRAFMNNISWADACKSIENYSKVTREDIINFANKYFKDNNYVVVYKRQGKPEDVEKVEKPPITPIFINRDVESDFFQSLKTNKINPIEPVFVNFDKAITKAKFQNNDILYIQNVENKTFQLTFRYEYGTANDLYIRLAFNQLEYLGTPNYSAAELNEEFYKLACSYSFNAGEEESSITLTGLSENMEKALDLLMDLLKNAQPDDAVLQNLVADYLKGRTDAKANQDAVLSALRNYCEYGKDAVAYKLTENQLKTVKSSELLALVAGVTTLSPTILYYGTASVSDLQKTLESKYQPAKIAFTPKAPTLFTPLATSENTVYFAPYDAKQARLATYTRGGIYDPKMYCDASMYNQYFGGGMSAIVFQEMREKRSLAYQARSAYQSPSKPDEYYANTSFIATQNDKIIDAFAAFNELFNDMPQAESSFKLAQESMLNAIETGRITKMSIIYTYLRNQKLDIATDLRKELYDAVPKFTLSDVTKFNEQFVKNQPKTYMVLSRESDVDFETLEAKFGKVTKLTLEDIFGY